jgi:hypothetical protein
VRKRVFYVSNNLTRGAVQTVPGYYQNTYLSLSCDGHKHVTTKSANLFFNVSLTQHAVQLSYRRPSNYHIATPGHQISHPHNMPSNYHSATPESEV